MRTFTIPETGRQYSTDDMFNRMSVVASVKCRWPLHPGYMHSFGMTENYFIIVEQPLSVSLSTAVMNRFRGDPLSNALKWFQDCPVSIELRETRPPPRRTCKDPRLISRMKNELKLIFFPNECTRNIS